MFLLLIIYFFIGFNFENPTAQDSSVNDFVNNYNFGIANKRIQQLSNQFYLYENGDLYVCWLFLLVIHIIQFEKTKQKRHVFYEDRKILS